MLGRGTPCKKIKLYLERDFSNIYLAFQRYFQEKLLKGLSSVKSLEPLKYRKINVDTLKNLINSSVLGMVQGSKGDLNCQTHTSCRGLAGSQ